MKDKNFEEVVKNFIYHIFYIDYFLMYKIYSIYNVEKIFEINNYIVFLIMFYIVLSRKSGDIRKLEELHKDVF